MFNKYCLSLIFILLLSPQYNALFSQHQTDQVEYYALVIDSIDRNTRAGNSAINLTYIESVLNNSTSHQYDCLELGTLYHKLGQSYYLLEYYFSAYTTFKNHTIPIWNTCINQSKIKIAHTLHAAALSGQYVNLFDEAIPLMNKALGYYESDSTYSNYNLARKYHGAGTMYMNANDLELAEIYYLKVIDLLSSEEQGKFLLSQALNDLGVLYQNRQAYEKAITQHMLSIENSNAFNRINFHNIANNYRALKKFNQAEKYATLENEMALATQDNSLIVESLELLGYIQYEQGNYKESLKAYDDQINLLIDEAQNNQTIRFIAKAYENSSLVHLKLNEYDIANNKIQESLHSIFVTQEFDENNNPIIAKNNARNNLEAIAILSTKAEILKEIRLASKKDFINQPEIDLYFKIDSLSMEMIPSISFSRSKLNFINNIIPYYEKAIQTFSEIYKETNEEEHFNLAYYFSSKLKAIILRLSIQKEALMNEADRQSFLKIQKSIDSLKLNYYNEPDISDSISSTLIKLQRSQKLFDKSISNNYHKESRVLTDDFNSYRYQKIKDKLPNDLLILDYFQGQDVLYCFFISQNNFGIHKTTLDNQFYSSLNIFSNSNKNPSSIDINDSNSASNALYHLLLDDIIKSNPSSPKKLLVIPDGTIHSIPLEALYTNSMDFLIKEYEITYTYSLQMAQTNISKKKYEYLGWATNYTSDLNKKIVEQRAVKEDIHLTDIPLSIEEIENSAKLFNSKIFINSKAIKESFTTHSGEGDILHLSVHGLVDYEVPENSNLLFNDQESDFILHSSEINSLNLNNDLVVLSACQSADGKTIKSEGVQGLSRSFLLAGASSVISSLWNSSEYSSSLVLPSFFKNYKNSKDKSRALHLAKLDYLDGVRPSLRHPFYWANYILIVNPSNEYLEDSNNYFPALPIFGLFISIILITWFYIKRKGES